MEDASLDSDRPQGNHYTIGITALLPKFALEKNAGVIFGVLVL